MFVLSIKREKPNYTKNIKTDPELFFELISPPIFKPLRISAKAGDFFWDSLLAISPLSRTGHPL